MSANRIAAPSAYPYSTRPANASGPRHADPEDLVLYAMQLLSGDEAAEQARHVEGCAECQRGLALILRDLAVYAFTVDLQSPPPLARQRLRTQVARENRHAFSAPPAFAAFGRNGSILSPDEEAEPRRNPMLTFLGWLGWIVAAALAVAAAMFYKETGDQRAHLSVQSGELARLDADAVRAQQLMDALAGPNATHVTLRPKPPVNPQPTGRILYDDAEGSLVFLAEDLDPLETNKAYELWLIPADGRTAIPVAAFHPNMQGDASVVLPALPKGVSVKSFGVTIEDAGGAQTPALPFVIAGS